MFRRLQEPFKTPLISAPRTLGVTLGILIALVLTTSSAKAQATSTWPPITPEDLALKDNPLSPGEPAIILYYEVQTDNMKSTETRYQKIKILREEGKKNANVEIPYFDTLAHVEDIRARVTSPDGKSEEFNGTIYDKEVVKMKKFRWSAKTFTLPNVEVGSVIEYSYLLREHNKIPDVFHSPYRYLIRDAAAYPAAEWEFQKALAMRHGHFVIHPIKGAETVTFTRALSLDEVRRTLPDGSIEINVDDIPAFQVEDYSPPEESLKIRADLYYVVGMGRDPQYFWMSVSKWVSERSEAFIGKPKSVKREADRIVDPNDSEETKLRKIYARVQQIRALNYEAEKSKKERKQESLKENKSVEDVLSRGYAFSGEINLAFIALTRAAGMQAYPVRLASRNRTFFTPERLNPNQLDSMVVEVRTSSSRKFLDPGTLYCPYGLLPWEEAGAGGIRIDKEEGQIEYTPKPETKDAVTRRQAELNLDADGNLEGNLTITYEGQDALSHRLKAIDEDEAERRKDLEETVRKTLPQGAVVKMLSSEGWTSSEVPQKVQFHIEAPNYANKAGQRLVLPLAVFHTNRQNPFASARRIHPVYFDYPAEIYDEVIFKLPAGIEIESLPPNEKIEAGASHYELTHVQENNSLRVRRQFKFALYFLPVERYPSLRGFYANIQTNDDQQAVLKPAQSASKN